MPLGSKIASLMGSLVLAAVLTLTTLSIQRERANFRLALETQADVLLETTALSLRDELYLVRLDELVDVSRALSDNPNINVFRIYDRNGRLLADSHTGANFSQEIDPLGLVLITQGSQQIEREWQSNQLIAGRAIILGNQVIGAVSVALSTRAMDEKINTLTAQGILLAAITLLIGGGLTVLFARQITIPLMELTDVAAEMSRGNLAARVAPRSKDEIGRLGKAFNQMAVGLQEREWLRDMFGRFVSKEVAEAIRTGRVRLEGENRVVSVLFCDIRDFTDFSEHHTPKEVVAMLNEYLPLVVQAAQKYGGMVNKFGGDSSLIIYGAPYDLEDSAYQAVLTAIEIRNGLVKINQRLKRSGERALRVGVGINTGVALAGAVGPSERQEYTVIGKTVNLAARIDGLNKNYPDHDILISGWTYEALGRHKDEFELISLGNVSIRGKNEPVSIWAVKSHK